MQRDLAVLVVEDDDDAASVVEMLLVDAARPGQALVSRARSLAEALDRVAGDLRPDVVLLDLGLPDTAPATDPLLPVRALVAMPDGPPVVVLTGDAGNQIGLDAIRHGAQDFVEKQRIATEAWRVWRTLLYAVERAERMAEIERQRTRLLKTNALLQHFGATIAHDIKGPIVRTTMTIRTLLAHRQALADEAVTELLETADRNLTALGDHIDGLVDDVVSTVDHRREPIVIDDQVAWLDGVLTPEDRDRLDLQVDAPAEIWGRVGALRQILHNLVGNALAHNPDRPHVVVRITTEDVGSDVLLHVEDDGVGIPEGLRESVFQPGVRGDALGTGGIGLAAVRLATDSMGGTVALSTSDLGGAAFEIRLPQRSGR